MLMSVCQGWGRRLGLYELPRLVVDVAAVDAGGGVDHELLRGILQP
jgi:hypothetical protein